VSELERFGERLRELWGSETRDAPLAADCSDPSRIWDALQGHATPEEVQALLDHSLSCPACAMAWRLARDISAEAAPSTSGPLQAVRLADTRAAGVRPVWRWAGALAASVLVVVGGIAVWRGFNAGTRDVGPDQAAARWADLEVPALAVDLAAATGELVFRDGERRAAGEAFGAAVEPYLEGEFAAAAERLGRYLESYPEDVQARLLLGVSLLRAGRPGDAVVPLEEAQSLGDADTVEDARFYLAVAYLKVGEEDRARTQLERIESGGGRWQTTAEGLLRRLAAGGDAHQ
jgi:Tetratricopeptide repeat